jgi:hypothetical protein
MSDSSNSGSDRRDFLKQVATAGVIASAGALAPFARANAEQPPHEAPFDDSWTLKVKAAKYKAVFDSPGLDDGLALSHATFYAQGYMEQLDAKIPEMGLVVVLRHLGTALALNDKLWEKYELGEHTKIKDRATDAFAKRNLVARKDERSNLVNPEASIESLIASGVVILACNKAGRNLAANMAKKFNRDVEEVRTEFREGLLPGVLWQPSGIYATHRAQEVGCTFIKST